MRPILYGSGEKPKRVYTFKTFQDLPEIARDGLVWWFRLYDEGFEVDERERTLWLIQMFGMNNRSGPERLKNGGLAIGTVINLFEQFIKDSVHLTMVRCYMDYACNLAAAKLAWEEGY